MSKPVLLYVHVPKCGGRTLSSMLRVNFRRSRVVHPLSLDKGLAEEMARIPAAELARARLVWGHYHYGIHEWIDRPYQYATMVRDPVRRVTSLYNYAKRVTSHPLHDWVRDEHVGLEEYIDSDVDTNQLNNGLVRQFVGMNDGVVTRQHLEQAKRNLDTFRVVGLTGRFDESFVMFRRRLDLRLPFYVTRNVSRAEEGAVELTPRARELVESRNELDLELFAHAEELFARQRAEEGEELERDVDRLRRANGRVERLSWVVQPAAATVGRAAWAERRR